MVMADEAKLSPTACTAVFQLSHEATSDLEIRRAVVPDGGANCRISNLNVHISNDLDLRGIGLRLPFGTLGDEPQNVGKSARLAGSMVVLDIFQSSRNWAQRGPCAPPR